MKEYIHSSDGKQYVKDDGQLFPCTGYIGQIKSGYMCATDFMHEVGEAEKTGPICDSVDSLRKVNPCVNECGWVRVLLVAVEYGKPQAVES